MNLKQNKYLHTSFISGLGNYMRLSIGHMLLVADNPLETDRQTILFN